MNGLGQDIRFALRQLCKSPGFATVAVLTLALGIGANTAIFSVVNGVLLRRLPFKEPDRLVEVWHVPPAKSFPGMTRFSVSAANFLDWQRENDVFSSMAIYTYHSLTLTGSGEPVQVDACAATSGFFETLGASPMLGRIFTADEDKPGAKVVVLSYRFWQEHLGSRPDVVDHNLQMDGQNYLVAGVMPPSFRFPDIAQMWMPMGWTDQEKAVRGEHHSIVIARLKAGIDIKQAQAEMTTISDRLAQLYPADDQGWGAVVVWLSAEMVEDVRPALLMLLGAVAFVLLIACANVANLALARTFSRQKEIAIRSALGASSSRVVRQLLTESVLLALVGGILGLLFAHFGTRLILVYLADKLPHSIEVNLNTEVLAFTLCVSVLTGILAGVLPAWRFGKSDVNQALKQGLGRTDVDSGGHGTRSVLVVAEVALSLVLLVGAGLMIRSFQRLENVPPGFDSHGVLTMITSVSRSKFPHPIDQIRFYDQVLARTRALPGVESAGVVDDIPLDNGGSIQPIAIEGQPVVAMADQPEVDVRLISPGYMSAMRTPILRGRDFNDQDVAGRPAAILISESMARRFWPNEDAIGKRLTMTFFPDQVRQVVGIVGDVKLDSLDQTRPSTVLYLPLDQITQSSGPTWGSFPMTLVVRSSTSPAIEVSAVRNAVSSVDDSIPIRDVHTMDDLVATSLEQPKFNMLLLGVFAGVALLLAALGIYSVLSYSVRRRVPEIGIRLALGARFSDVLRMVVFEGMKPALLGVAIGVAAALAMGRLVASMVFQVKPTDPFTFLAVVGLLALIALLACVVPAYRASKVDPIVALRYE